MKALKISALFVFLACMMLTQAQVAVNSTGAAPAGSSMLDISSTTKGLLIPRMTESDRLAISTPATGLTVYQTNSQAGFWVYDGSTWKRLYSGTGSAWDASGNSGTVSGTNFLGTTDNQALDIRTNNMLRARITMKGQIETFNPMLSVFLGEEAGTADDLSVKYNVFVGYRSGRYNSSGMKNAATGGYAMEDNTTGNNNTANGYGALQDNQTGNDNTAIGHYALNTNSSGIANTAVGFYCLRINTTAGQNIAIGNNALRSQSYNNSNTPWNSDNVAVGVEALYSNQPTSTSNGIKNTAMGNFALHNNTTGFSNTAIGYCTLFSNSTGSYNVATGLESLSANTNGSNNTANGYRALYTNTTGYSNTACGMNALASNTAGYENTAVGRAALYSNTAAFHNIAVGYKALYTQSFNIEGSPWESNNIAIGMEALYSNQPTYYDNGVKNIAIGDYALHENTTGNSNIAIGYYSLYTNTSGGYNIGVGMESLKDNTTGTCNTATGFSALKYNSTGENNTAYGYYASIHNTKGNNNTACGYRTLWVNTTAGQNIAIGSDALRTQSFNNSNSIWNSDNLAIGFEAMFSNQPTSTSNGIKNTALGNYALHENTTGFANTALGYNTLYDNTTGFNNVAIGLESLTDNTTGSYNTADGFRALYMNTTGYSNTACGMNALALNTTGYENTAVGRAALYSNLPTADENGRRNTAVGFKALYSNTTGYENTALGYQAFQNGASYYNSMALGYNTSITASDQVRIGNSAVTSIGGQVGWTTLSDARFKRNIKEDVPGLEFIMKLRPVTYTIDLEAQADYIGTPDSLRSEIADALQGRILYTGFLAQEVEEAAISTGFSFSGVDAPKHENDFYGLRYAEFTVPLVKAVQEQQVVIDNQELRLKDVEEENKKLKSENAAVLQNISQLRDELNDLKEMIQNKLQ